MSLNPNRHPCADAVASLTRGLEPPDQHKLQFLVDPEIGTRPCSPVSVAHVSDSDVLCVFHLVVVERFKLLNFIRTLLRCD